MPEALPKTLEEAVSNIVESLDGESRQKLLDCDIRDLYKFHGMWGMGIRNEFNLFGNTDRSWFSLWNLPDGLHDFGSSHCYPANNP